MSETNGMAVKRDSPIVEALASDAGAIAELLSVYGSVSVAYLAHEIKLLKARVAESEHEIARLKLVNSGFQMDLESSKQAREKLIGQLKTRFEGIEKRIGAKEP